MSSLKVHSPTKV